MSDITWTCPYCQQIATITSNNFSVNTHAFNRGNKIGELGLETIITVCPNSKCKEYTIEATLHKRVTNTIGNWYNVVDDNLGYWRLRPQSEAKQYPVYIPETIRKDYEEACLIASLSPKASATLSRRCLQGIIRDFWGISKNRLVEEITAIQDKVDPTTWQAIDAIRKIGNIGAHMEKDINTIVDVEPQEAKLLVALIEVLLKDWYIARHERKLQLQAIIDVAKSKEVNKLGTN